MKKVLIVGSGGREHSLGWKLKQSEDAIKLYFAPGNGGTSQIGKNVDIQVTELEKLVGFVQDNNIDFTVVGPEAALEVGVVDAFNQAELPIFGPTKAGAQLETSKAFTADFLERHNIPRPGSFTATNLDEAMQYVENKDPKSYVIKASGLAAGKGVVLPETAEEAAEALKNMLSGNAFGSAGETVVIQERLSGQEVSAFAISDGKNAVMLPFFQDHKQVYEGDKGPNTGGMGAYSPVPIVTPEVARKIEDEIIMPTVAGMLADGNEYKGVVYAGLFVTDDGQPKVIEYNSRFGDPECQPMMLLLESDLLELLEGSARGDVTDYQIKVSDKAAACVVLTSGGYPGSYETGKTIKGLDRASDDVIVFQAGTEMLDDYLVSSGGRVLNVTAAANNLKSALEIAYKNIGQNAVHFENMHYRKDIGHRVL